MFKIEGTIKVLNDTVQVTEKFSKREFVITDESSMYPQDILFQLAQDNCSILDGLKVGENVEVSFNLRGREWTSPQGEVRYFNTLDAWRVEKCSKSDAPVSNNKPVESKATTSESPDLPF
jgi:hypothetical protein